MQGERASIGYLSEALNIEHGSTSSNGVIDHWENIHSLGDSDLQDYMIANSEPSAANSVYHEQYDLHRFSLGENSSSGEKNEDSSLSEQRRNEIIDLDSDSEQPFGANQHVQNVNLNAGYIELDESINPVRDRSGFFEAPFEESNVRTGSSVEGRRASCKRKALEGSIVQTSSGGYGDFQHGESSSWTPASIDHRPGNGLNISGPRGQVSATLLTESSSRNTCVRSTPSHQQEAVNPAVFSAGTVVRRPVARLLPEDQQQMSDLRHGQSLGNVISGNSNSPAISIPPVSRNMPPPFQWTEVSLAGGSSNSTVPVERNLYLDETRSRSISENPLFIPAPQLRNISQSQSSRNATSGSLNIASSVSRTGSITSVQPPSSNLAWTPYHNMRAGRWLDRQGDSVAGAPHSVRALSAASRERSRLMVSQMQNILDVMRRDPNHNLRLEDLMLLNQSLLLDGAAGVHDHYRDMRLDVDNMSYEELLALEERIGDVCTGVNEETISKWLKQRKFKSSTKSPQDAEPCCICQEEYSEGEDMGTLECGHGFHSQCIKEWLKQKNRCPICKMTGLNTAKKLKIG